MLEEYASVTTLVERDGFPAGTPGIVVSRYGNSDVYEIELLDPSGASIDVVTFREHEVAEKTLDSYS